MNLASRKSGVPAAVERSSRTQIGKGNEEDELKR
jgi:hypothetical protein